MTNSTDVATSPPDLWCVNIQGPDDVIAVASRVEAIDYATRFNRWWLSFVQERGLHKHDPLMWAVPVSWPHDAASHAKNLGDLGEYGWLRDQPAFTAATENAKLREALEPLSQAADDAERTAGHDGPLGQFIPFDVLARARTALQEVQK